MKHISLRKTLMIALLTISMQSFAQPNPIIIGTLQAGDSVLIVYDVTINDPLPAGTTKIGTQGTVSGSNFTTLVTDDPATVAANDSTFIFLNIFPLPVTLQSLKAYQNGGAIDIAWTISSEVSLQKYVVEKSTDARTFLAIGDRQANNSGTYILGDQYPVTGANYYRLRFIENNGSFKYSNIVKVDIGNKGKAIVLYPNPTFSKTVTFQLTNVNKGEYNFIFYNNAGRQVFSKRITHTGGSAAQTIQLPQELAAGVYMVQLTNDGNRLNQLLIIN